MKFFQLLLLPFSVLYGIGIWIWHRLYTWGVLQSFQFDIPVISVGNLSVGGTGKSPMIEYLIRLLNGQYKVATLSRGYGRKTSGYLLGTTDSKADEIGDEPKQFKTNFPELAVAVCENRSLGIPNLLYDVPETQVVLMDDAFQSLSVKPGLSILLTEYDHIFTGDILLPAGRLREFRSAYRRADIILVTKCPSTISDRRKDKILHDIQPLPHQQVYFSCLQYGSPYAWTNRKDTLTLNKSYEIVLLCGIAKADLLVQYLKEHTQSVRLLQFSDHHRYTIHDLKQLKKEFITLSSNQKIIITTEKDAMRLEAFQSWITENQLPVYSLPVSIGFLDDEGKFFDQYILNYLKNV